MANHNRKRPRFQFIGLCAVQSLRSQLGQFSKLAAIRRASLPGEELRGRARAIDVLNIT
jgi:hypothetical protein